MDHCFSFIINGFIAHVGISYMQVPTQPTIQAKQCSKHWDTFTEKIPEFSTRKYGQEQGYFHYFNIDIQKPDLKYVHKSMHNSLLVYYVFPQSLILHNITKIS